MPAEGHACRHARPIEDRPALGHRPERYMRIADGQIADRSMIATVRSEQAADPPRTGRGESDQA